MKKTLSLVIALIMLISLTACGISRTEDEGNVVLYYINSLGTGLVTEKADLEAETTDEAVNGMIALIDRAPFDPSFKKPKPDSIRIQDWYIASGIVTLNFTAGYSALSTIDEILMRAAIVKDFCQLEGVEAVSFLVGGRPLSGENGNVVGNMTAANFVDILNRSETETRENMHTLYFPIDDGDELSMALIKVTEPIEKRREEVILEQLIAGPEEDLLSEGFKACINPKCTVLKLKTKNDTCYIDFDKSFLENMPGVSIEAKVFSVVNSIATVTGINKVKITVEGAENKQITEFETDGFLLTNMGIVRW